MRCYISMGYPVNKFKYKYKSMVSPEYRIQERCDGSYALSVSVRVDLSVVSVYW